MTRVVELKLTLMKKHPLEVPTRVQKALLLTPHFVLKQIYASQLLKIDFGRSSYLKALKILQ